MPKTENPPFKPYQKAIRIWLFAIAALVCLMVLVGGATRMTDSGLSITEWRPITGTLPPLSQESWLNEFEKYKQIPEYQKVNKGMSLEEFKVIYYWEWGHRLLGRIIGLAFALPMAFFWLKGALTPWLKKRSLLLLALGAGQGFLGWFMVQSGLTERVDVAPLRLASHLTLAIIILALLVSTAMALKTSDDPKNIKFNAGNLILLKLVIAQIFLGGLVAGLDAGLTFRTWPLMDGAFIPPASALFAAQPWWINLWENPLTVQFIHRMTAYALFFYAAILVWNTIAAEGWVASRARRIVFGLITLQAAIGIKALVLGVPMALGLLHQAGAILVLIAAVWLLWREAEKISPPALAPDLR